jgi:hypothetical protein
MEALRNRVPDPMHASTAVTLLELQHQQQNQIQNGTSGSPVYEPIEHQFQQPQIREDEYTSPASMSVSSHPSGTRSEVPYPRPQMFESPSAVSYGGSDLKRKRGHFELNIERSVDVVAKGLISLADAELYFRTFFQGCVSLSILNLVNYTKGV